MDQADEARGAAKAQLHKRARGIATRLNPKTGQIADSAALCAYVGCSRQAYYDAVRRHGNHSRGGRPRTEQTLRLVHLLEASGDVRFRQPGDAAAEAAVKKLASASGARM